MLSALLFVAYMSTLTGPTPLMSGDYQFIKLVRRVFGSALPRKNGVATDDLAELKRIAAAIIADDTTLTADSKRALEELLEALFKWVYDMRAAPNLTKYQLCCSEGDIGANGEAHSLHVGSAGLVEAQREVKLVGGKISCDTSRDAVLRTYTPCVMMYQLTLELVMMKHNHDDASELERSCPMQKFMAAACRDSRIVGHECIADDLQRRLWHTGCDRHRALEHTHGTDADTRRSVMAKQVASGENSRVGEPYTSDSSELLARHSSSALQCPLHRRVGGRNSAHRPTDCKRARGHAYVRF